MTFSFSASRQLLRHIERHWPRLTDTECDDVAQQALCRALEVEPGADEAALLRLAIDGAARVVADMDNEKRRGHRLANPAAATARESAPDESRTDVEEELSLSEPDERLLPRLRPRAPRRPYAPSGAVRVVVKDVGAHYVHASVGGLPTRKDRLMARRLHEACERIMHFEPLSSAERTRFEEAHRMFFGNENPIDCWAEILVDEIRRAACERLDWLDLLARSASDFDFEGLSLGFRRKPAALKLDPATPKHVQVPVQPVVISQRGLRRVIALIGRLLGKRRVLGACVTVETDTLPGLPYDALFRAHQVLLRTVERLGAWPEAPSLPEYIVDAEVIAWLVERFGFDGGGGGNGKITAATMTALVLDPVAMERELQRYAERQVERADDELAIKLREGFGGMLQRLRGSVGAAAR